VNPYLSEVVVLEGSPLAGRTLSAAHVGEQYDLEVLSLCRDGTVIGLPGPDDHVQVGDILIVQAPASVLMSLRDDMGIAVKHGRHPDDADLGAVDTGLVEAVVAPNSELEGRTLKQVGFRRRFGAVVLAIRRHGEDIVERLGSVRLRSGDELLVLGHHENLEQLPRRARVMVLQTLELAPFRPWRVVIAGLIVAAVVATAALELLPIAEAAVVGAVLMVATRCLSLRRAYAAVDWKVIFLLAGLIPMGIALESSGAAAMTVRGLLSVVGDHGPHVVLGAIYLLTAALTGFLSNNATAVLLAPLAVTTARDLGVDPRPFLVAVAFAASAAFYTPIGYQTNLLVYGPGGYRFADFLRLGGPLNLLIWILACFLIPLFFPFR
jgi:di/tricarboxylate transporter